VAQAVWQLKAVIGALIGCRPFLAARGRVTPLHGCRSCSFGRRGPLSVVLR
jgi:hypothetical protein